KGTLCRSGSGNRVPFLNLKCNTEEGYMKSKLKWLLVASLWLSVPLPSSAQLNTGGKFLGNVYQSSTPTNFSMYWNQVTPENAGKWGSVESSRDSMNWGGLDNAYNFAQSNGYPFKQHNFVWGSQQPGWLGGLSATEQRAEVEEWIAAYCERYPATNYI